MLVPLKEPNDKAAMAMWLAGKLGYTVHELIGSSPFEICCVALHGYPVGAVMYTNYRGTSVEMLCAGEKGWLSRRLDIRGLFSYPFIQMQCYTVISCVRRSNANARKFNERLGFTPLGAIESGLGRSEDTILYTMTRPNCRWLLPSDHAAVISRAIPPATNGVKTHGERRA